MLNGVIIVLNVVGNACSERSENYMRILQFKLAFCNWHFVKKN